MITSSSSSSSSSLVNRISTSVKETSNNELPPIRVIDYNDFARRKSFPRYPENKDITLLIDTIDKENSFLVFISHCWLRGWPGAVGWSGRPHPDNEKNEKFYLCKKGIVQAWKSLAPHMKKCYIWLDFGCMNQDADPAGELKQLHDIVGSCDCLFTPIVQRSDFNWRFNPCYENIYVEYMADAWKTGPYAYLNRGWTRVEMLYASTIPLCYKYTKKDSKRLEKFAEGMKYQHSLGHRPHLLYGTHELKKSLPVIVIPPLSNSYFEDFHPEKGYVSYEQDRIKIRSLVQWIQPMVTKGTSGYEGEYNEDKEKHGMGTEIYPNGNIYTGTFQHGKRQGKGKLQRSDGGYYEGDWNNDEISGIGTFYVASGDVYVGEFQNGIISGKGKLTVHLGFVIEGVFQNSLPKYAKIYALDGTVLFQGECTDDGFPKLNIYYCLKILSLFCCCLIPCGCVRLTRSNQEGTHSLTYSPTHSLKPNLTHSLGSIKTVLKAEISAMTMNKL